MINYLKENKIKSPTSMATTFIVLFTICLVACSKYDDPVITDPISNDKLRITVGSTVFTATLYDNATTTAFTALLPLTLNMSELNGNEKFYDLSGNLSTNAFNLGTIQNGDIVLYGSRTLVLFYKIWSTSYSYTRIEKVDNPTELAAALGSGSVTIKYELD